MPQSFRLEVFKSLTKKFSLNPNYFASSLPISNFPFMSKIMRCDDAISFSFPYLGHRYQPKLIRAQCYFILEWHLNKCRVQLFILNLKVLLQLQSFNYAVKSNISNDLWAAHPGQMILVSSNSALELWLSLGTLSHFWKSKHQSLMLPSVHLTLWFD